MEKKRSVQVLYLGSIERNEEYPASDKATDEIDFGRPVRVTLIRIPKLKRQLYGKFISITQSEPIKNFEIYFRNLEETSGRYSLLASNSELMATSTSDILITPTVAFVTDLLVVRGVFTKLSMCIYGDLIEEEEVRLWREEAMIAEPSMTVEIKRDIFGEKRNIIGQLQAQVEQLQREGLNLSVLDNWQDVVNDDDINEPQIKNISNISQHLLNTFQQINDDTYIVKFRENIQNINNMLQKLFKSKQIGLYYNKEQNYALQNQIPLPLAEIGLESLKLLPSDQFRVLEMLKMLAQLPRHATTIIQRGGVAQLTDLFLQFYMPNAMIFSTFKNLVLEVCIALSQWPTAAQRMVTKLQQDKYNEIGKPILESVMEISKYQEVTKEKPKDKVKDKEKSKGKSRSRSRDKSKQKRARTQSPSDDSQSEKDKHKKDKSKKDRKDKKKKDKIKEKPRDKSKGRDQKKKRDRSKEREDKKEKEKKKDRQQSKSRIQQSDAHSLEKRQSEMKIQKPEQQVETKVLSFYQLLFFVMLNEKNSKTLNLIKILTQQIVQTLTKNKQVSQQLASVTSFLRDTKYLFNQGTEIINAKSLKIFATFQPFLNEIQSENVDCSYIAEKEKLKHPLKYGINPKTFKILSDINKAIVTHSPKNSRAFGTAFNQDFMVMMSELIFEKEKSILSGFNRIVSSFKAQGLMLLQRHEAAISIIAQYVYKALLDDEGLNTLLYLDQIYGSLIKFISFLNQDPSLFSTELKSRVKLLSNYATPYDHFSRSDGVFKVFCQYFLKLFKYENYEIEINNKAKITDFRKKEYQKLINPFSYENLTQNYALKNFNDVSSSQPLLEIDVCLKIFLVLCDYNKNIWTTFYENKLVNGLSSLLNKVSSLLIFFLQHSANRWTNFASTKNYLGTLDNYLTVVKHILMLMAKKCRYESAYNDLLEDDIFQDVELYQRAIEIFITIYNAIHDETLLVYIQKSRHKMIIIMSLVMKIFDHFLTSFQLLSHQTRQAKLNRLLEHLFIKHYSQVNSRAAILAIYAHIIKLSEGNTAKYFLLHFLDGSFTLNKLWQNQVAYIPTSDSMMENLLRTNIFRANPHISNNLSLLLKNLFSKTNLFDKTLDIVDKLFQDIDEISKKNQQEEGQIGWTALRKAHLFSEIIVKTGVVFKSRLDDRLMRFFRRLIEGYRKRYDMMDKKDKKQLQNFIIFLKTKNNFMTYFGLLVKENLQNTIFLNFYQMTSKVLTFQFYQPNEEIQSQTSAYKREINFEIIKACKIYTQSLADIGLHAYYQCLLLYGEVLERPYKPQTFLNFSQTISILEKIFIDHQLDFKIRNQIHQIMHSIFLFLCKLTSIDGQNLFTTESRRLAIISLIVPNDKQFPFKAIKSSDLLRFIPKELISLLEQFFNYPIVEKPIVLLQKNETKSSSKPKITIFSKSVFNIISEHEPVSKARYKYIGGQWVSGDIQKSTYTPFRKRNYIEEIQKTLLKKSTADYQPYHSTHRSMRKQQLIFNQLFYLTLNKSKQDVPKKQVDKTIQLKDVIPRSTPQEIRREPPPPPVPINPSPSRTLGGADKRMPGYNNMTGREGISRSPIPPDRQYNRNSNPRSSSQNNNAAHYSSPPKYYDPRANMVQPPRSVQPSVPSQGYHSSHMHQQGQHNYYNPNQQQSYDNRYYNPHPPHSGHHNQRYIPPSNYGPPPAQVYMNPTQPMIRSVPPPATGIYPHHNIAGMYGQSMNHLNQYEEQLLNEAFSLLNQIKTSGLSESDMSVKKSRLNFILSNHPKVHQRLKEILPQKS